MSQARSRVESSRRREATARRGEIERCAKRPRQQALSQEIGSAFEGRAAVLERQLREMSGSFDELLIGGAVQEIARLMNLLESGLFKAGSFHVARSPAKRSVSSGS